MNMRILQFGLGALLVASTACYGQAPAGGQATSSRPDDATGQCKDGTYTTNPNKGKACKDHQGVKSWYQTVGGAADPDIKGGGTATHSKSGKQPEKPNDTANPKDNSAVSNQRADAINKKSPDTVVATPDDNGKTIPGPGASGGATASPNGNNAKGSSGSVAGRKAAPGGGPGMVWVNTDSNTYHCYGTRYYGKTKNGKYESESDAVNGGAKPERGKSCSAQ
jgi:hypothetical protein